MFLQMMQWIFVLFMFGVKMKKLGQVMKQMILLKVINSFLNNYLKEQQVSREKSNLVFDSVDLMQ